MFFSNFSYSSFYSSVCLFLFSKPASEVKPGRAGLVHGWVTVREYAVSWGPFPSPDYRPRGDFNRGCAMSFWRPWRGFGCEGNPTELLRQVTALHRRKSRRPPMCGTPCFPRTASDSDMIFDDLDLTWFSHFGISSFRCLNTPQNNRPVNLSAHDKTKDENKTCGLVSCFTRLFDSVINKHRAKRQVSRTTKKLLNLSNSALKALSVSP